MATPTPPKSMSSRLLTMKFMQRAVASPSSSSPNTPTPDEHASKRRKLAIHPARSENRESVAHIDHAAVQAAIAEEQRKQQDALVQRAAELGDARWVLDVADKIAGPTRDIQTPLNVVQVGFAQIDSQIDPSDAAGLDAESTDASHARTPVVRRYNMDRKKAAKDDESDNDDSNSDSNSDTSSQGNEVRRQSYGQRSETRSSSSRPALASKKSAEWAKAKQLAEARRKKDVKLNSPKPSSTSGGLLSISSGGGTSRPPPSFTCHRCGKPGHKAVECKNAPKRTAR
ncbi:hypothetical protein F4804DRAFT_260716 [Jackrogersella minutella]|nr:hypothetical protein F4804DRAFT_260716 [Jackrogersella minutella]